MGYSNGLNGQGLASNYPATKSNT